MASVRETLAKLGKLSDEEVAELTEDNRRGVAAAAVKEQERRAAAAIPPDTGEPSLAQGDSFDLVGADGRRIVRWYSRNACEALGARIRSETGEKTRIVSSSARY